MVSPSLTACLKVAVAVSQRAGKLQASHMGRPRTVGTKSSAIDLVTEIDKASERMIVEAITSRFPDHGYQGEEGAAINPDSPYRWVVDPLDGTTNFVHGVPVFGVSIGLLHGGKVVLGVIHDPTQKETFTAVKGRGAWLNGKRMRVSGAKRLEDGLLSTGFSAKFRKDPVQYLEWFTEFQARTHAVRRMGSTALSLAYVAAGRQDGFYEKDLWPWDIAAGLLLVEEAGGRVSDFHGKPVKLEEGKVVASNGHLHRAMLRVIARPGSLKKFFRK